MNAAARIEAVPPAIVRALRRIRCNARSQVQPRGGRIMSDKFTRAVGDGSRRMTYAELAQARAISLASARRLVRRHNWHRQIGNDGVVRVTVPLGQLRTDPGPNQRLGPEPSLGSGPRPTPETLRGSLGPSGPGPA